MKVTFLGTSAGIPTKSRNVSSIALSLEQRSDVWLFDCGEGTQHQIMHSLEVKLSNIRKIFITHLHGDHVFGLFGLLATSGMGAHSEGIDVYGPRGLSDVLDTVFYRCGSPPQFPLNVFETEKSLNNPLYEGEGYQVFALPLKHRLKAFGYRVVQKDKRGTFNAELAKAQGIPFGPLYGRLKNGERIELPDGRVFDGKDFTGPDIRGGIFTYCTDTAYCENSVLLASEADLLVHEATFTHEDLDLARHTTHSTAQEAASVAMEAKAKKLCITHFSPRYTDYRDLLNDARSVFPNTVAAHDFLTLNVK